MDLNKTTVCSVALPSEAAREARVVAAMEGTSRSALMRQLLLDYLEGYPDQATRQRELRVERETEYVTA